VASGAVRAVESGEGPGPRAEFIISGEYDTFQQVLSGKLDPVRALKSGRLRLQGNMMRALRLTSFIETIMAEAGDIPTIF
jgi:putative sterol carrier protein